jgi:hypothetical protein
MFCEEPIGHMQVGSAWFAAEYATLHHKMVISQNDLIVRCREWKVIPLADADHFPGQGVAEVIAAD